MCALLVDDTLLCTKWKPQIHIRFRWSRAALSHYYSKLCIDVWFRSGRRDVVAVQQHRVLWKNITICVDKNHNMYFQEHLTEYQNAQRPLWKAINHITGRQQQRLPPSIPLSTLKSYIKSLFTQHQSPCSQLAIPEGPSNDSTLTQFQPVTARRVKDLLMKLNEKKSAGHDGVCSN